VTGEALGETGRERKSRSRRPTDFVSPQRAALDTALGHRPILGIDGTMAQQTHLLFDTSCISFAAHQLRLRARSSLACGQTTIALYERLHMAKVIDRTQTAHRRPHIDKR